MRTLLLLFIISFSASAQNAILDAKVAQEKTNALTIQDERHFQLVEVFHRQNKTDSFVVVNLVTNVVLIKDGSVTKMQMPQDSAVLFIAEDGVTLYKGITTWSKPQTFDTTFVEKEAYDDPSGAAASRWTELVNIAKFKPTTKPGVYNNGFSSVSMTTSTSKATTKFTGDVVQFFGERFNGHGNVKVYVDGVQVKTLSQGAQPWVTDFDRKVPSFTYVFPKQPQYNSPATEHTLTFETEPGNQYIIDMIRVLNYTLSLNK